MPLITRLFIKSAMVCLVAALLSGVLIALRPILSLPPFVAGLTPVYFHLFMVGWVTQIIFGVAYWMFPKQSKETPRGSEWLAWNTYLLLNAGLLLRAVAEPMLLLQTWPVWGWMLAASALCQWLAGLAFAVNTWPRDKVR